LDTSDKDNQKKNKIIVFDWNGTPLRIYTTDKSVVSFDVDREHKTIYAITDDPDFYIVTFKYK
jgi:2-keto-3-deoxy-galactonokinase